MDEPTEDSAVIFFREMVEPTVAEFRNDQLDPRRGFLACVTLSAMVEHYALSHPQASGGLSAFKSFIKSPENGAWAAHAVHDVANAFKHKKRTQSGWGYGDISLQLLGKFGYARFGQPMAGHMILAGPAGEWPLIQLVEAAADFWRQRLGIIGAEE